MTTQLAQGSRQLINTVVFTSSPTNVTSPPAPAPPVVNPFGNLAFINYLDQDILASDDDILFASGNPGSPNFAAVTLDKAERVGFGQGGDYSPNISTLQNATWLGWAADLSPQLEAAIRGGGDHRSPKTGRLRHERPADLR